MTKIDIANDCEKAGYDEQEQLLRDAFAAIYPVTGDDENGDEWIDRADRFEELLDANALVEAALMLPPPNLIVMIVNSSMKHPTDADLTKATAVVGDPRIEPTDPDVMLREAATRPLALASASLRAWERLA